MDAATVSMEVTAGGIESTSTPVVEPVLFRVRAALLPWLSWMVPPSRTRLGAYRDAVESSSPLATTVTEYQRARAGSAYIVSVYRAARIKCDLHVRRATSGVDCDSFVEVTVKSRS